MIHTNVIGMLLTCTEVFRKSSILYIFLDILGIWRFPTSLRSCCPDFSSPFFASSDASVRLQTTLTPGAFGIGSERKHVNLYIMSKNVQNSISSIAKANEACLILCFLVRLSFHWPCFKLQTTFTLWLWPTLGKCKHAKQHEALHIIE